MNLKAFLSDFPNQNGATVTGLLLILVTGAVVVVRLAMGQPFPDGYDSWLLFLGTLAGVSMVGMIGKRATDIDLAKAKASAPAAVTIEAGANVTMEHRAVVKPVPVEPPNAIRLERTSAATARDMMRGEAAPPGADF